MKKLLLLIGAGIGYVLGAKAGRDRYDTIADQASKVWGDPRVQSKVEDVRTQAPQVASSLGDKAKDAAGQAKARVSGHETLDSEGVYDNPTGEVDSDGDMVIDETGFGPGGDKLP